MLIWSGWDLKHVEGDHLKIAFIFSEKAHVSVLPYVFTLPDTVCHFVLLFEWVEVIPWVETWKIKASRAGNV